MSHITKEPWHWQLVLSLWIPFTNLIVIASSYKLQAVVAAVEVETKVVISNHLVVAMVPKVITPVVLPLLLLNKMIIRIPRMCKLIDISTKQYWREVLLGMKSRKFVMKHSNTTSLLFAFPHVSYIKLNITFQVPMYR